MNNDVSSPEPVRPTATPATDDLGGGPGATSGLARHPLLTFTVLALVISWLPIIPYALGLFPVTAAGLRPLPGGDHHRRRGRGKEGVARLFPPPDPVAGGCGLVRRCVPRSGGRLGDRRVRERPARGGATHAGPAGGLVADHHLHADLPDQSLRPAPSRNLVGAGMHCPCCCAATPRWWPAPCWA